MDLTLTSIGFLARQQACKSNADNSCRSQYTDMHLTDLLLSAAPVESHVGAIVVSALVLVEATSVPVCTQQRVGLSQRLRNVGPAPWHLRRCKSAQLQISPADSRSWISSQDILPKATDPVLPFKSRGDCALRSDGVRESS